MKPNVKYKELKLGFAALVYSLILLLVLANSLVNSIIKPDTEWWGFWYMFTNQSNIIVFVWLLCYGIGTFVDGRVKKFAENNTVITAVTVYISITFFIVATVLEPFYKAKFDPLNSLFLHFASAIVMWFFFFFVKGNGSTKYRQAFFILIYPFLFTVLNLIVGYNVNFISDGRPAFAYDFINPNSYGNIGIFIVVILLLIGIFGGFGILLIKFKRFIIKNYHLKLESELTNVADTTQSVDPIVNVDAVQKIQTDSEQNK